MGWEMWWLSGNEPCGLRRCLLGKNNDGRSGRRERKGMVVGTPREWMRLLGYDPLLGT